MRGPSETNRLAALRNELDLMDRDDTDKGSTPPPSSYTIGTNPDPPRQRALPPPDRAKLQGFQTEDEELLNRPVPALPRARAPELAAFTHTDPWRVLRIQGEFVHGFNALADIGAGVAVFGSA